MTLLEALKLLGVCSIPNSEHVNVLSPRPSSNLFHLNNTVKKPPMPKFSATPKGNLTKIKLNLKKKPGDEDQLISFRKSESEFGDKKKEDPFS
jgi:hypothetical protein